MKSLVSIIVPIYNVEQYLKKCIESIINQTLTNIEIILVNDGSTDNCGKIIDEYAKKDNRIIALHKENGGQASARNMGLDIASGKYIGFVDSDDWVDSNIYEMMYNSIEESKSDICVCGRKTYSSNEKLNYKLDITDETIDFRYHKVEEYVSKRLFYKHTVSSCNKLYSKEIIEKNNIRFKDVSYVGSEDTLFNYSILCCANSIRCIGKVYYNQLSREGSTARTYKPGYMNRTANMIKCMSDYSKEINSMMIYNDLSPLFLLFFYQWNMSNIKAVKNESLEQIIVKEITEASFNKEFMECVRKLAFDMNFTDSIKKMGFGSSGILYIRLIMVLYYLKLYKLATKTIMLK